MDNFQITENGFQNIGKITENAFQNIELLTYFGLTDHGGQVIYAGELHNQVPNLENILYKFMELIKNNEIQLYTSDGRKLDFNLNTSQINTAKLVYYYEIGDWNQINEMLRNKDLVFSEAELEEYCKLDELKPLIENAGLKLYDFLEPLPNEI